MGNRDDGQNLPGEVGDRESRAAIRIHCTTSRMRVVAEESGATPSKSDIIASKRLLRYLRGTQDLGLKLQLQNRACSTLTVFTDSDWAGDRPTRKSVSSWVIILDGFLISAGARTQSVIAQSSCEAEYIAATAATSEAKTTREHPSAFRQLWRHWCGKQKRSAAVTPSGRAISVDVRISYVPGPENVADANTKPVDKRSLEFCR